MRYSQKLAFKFFLKIRRWFYSFISDNKPLRSRIIVHQPVYFTGNGKIVLEEDVTFGYHPSPALLNGYTYIEARDKESSILIKKQTHINNSASIIAHKAKIVIGENCLIGPDCKIMTSNFHPLNPEERKSNNYDGKDIIIGNNVFIGMNVTVLKGSTIGNNSVISVGAIVTGDIPPNVIAGGIPCKVIKTLQG